MIPITHAFYLASLLLLLGLVGLVLRRSLFGALCAVQIMLCAGHLALVAAARIWASVDGHALALLALTAMVAQGVLGAALALVWLRERDPDEPAPTL
ncbi:MAG: NADH-quinone oxidoreductase subunit K [Myxococcales bacterium]|nr:NADH-quinone oxidoreductase subunit K [Myxococcales bacterium]MCB9704231.1 NADH-quinone oxidoreductase subunit K [Myxococcales bacterium]